MHKCRMCTFPQLSKPEHFKIKKTSTAVCGYHNHFSQLAYNNTYAKL